MLVFNSSRDLLVESLRLLCGREGGRTKVVAAIGCTNQVLG